MVTRDLTGATEISQTRLLKQALVVTVAQNVSSLLQIQNRFKGLDLVDRVSEELWTKVHYIVKEQAVTKTIPKKKKHKKAKGLSEEALQIAEKRREKAKEKEKDISN